MYFILRNHDFAVLNVVVLQPQNLQSFWNATKQNKTDQKKEPRKPS